MFSMITNIYNNNNCSQPQENWKSFFFWQPEMFDVCNTGDTAHIDYNIQVLATHASTWVNMVITYTRIA
jgi:uncharacterized Zn-finger protein